MSLAHIGSHERKKLYWQYAAHMLPESFIRLVVSHTQHDRLSSGIISKDEPKMSDFTYTLSTIGTPESEWDLIQEVQFKGIDLNPSYDEKWVRRINYEIELHVDSGF